MSAYSILVKPLFANPNRGKITNVAQGKAALVPSVDSKVLVRQRSSKLIGRIEPVEICRHT